MEKNQTPVGEPVTASRFDRVRSILTAANGASLADYQGLNDPARGIFWWNLSREEFLQVRIAGLPMIAPAGNEIRVHGREVKIEVPAVADYWSCAPDPAANGNGSDGTPSCCRPEAVNKKYPGRGAASNLVKALRGEAPFDAPNGHFPPFMWGGATVAPMDIQFISDWIDDGCPETDVLPPAANGKKQLLSLGVESHPVARKTSNAIQNGRGGLRQRKDVDTLTPDEVCQWRYVHNEMIQLNRFPRDRRNWNYWGRIHGDECQHGWEQFLLWHRMFLYEFEQRCQDIIPDVTLPYWNWASPKYLAGNLAPQQDVKIPAGIKSPMPIAFTSGIVPEPYRCFLNKAGAKKLVAQGIGSRIEEMIGFRYNSDAEFFWVAEQLIGIIPPASKGLIRQVLIDINPLWYPFRWPAMFYDDKGVPLGESRMEAHFHHHFPTQQDIDMILKIERWIDFGGGPSYDMSFGALDMDPHNTVHIWLGGFNPYCAGNKVIQDQTGRIPPPDDTNGYPYQGNFWETEPPMGDMLNNLTAAYDPIFWPHHAMIDRLFHIWQESHPGQQPFDPEASLSGLNYTAKDAATTRGLGYEYSMGSYHFESDRSTGFSRLNTEPAGVSAHALHHHRRAEVRLHNVIQPNLSFGIRVFLNQPDANVNTPVTGNDHYAGYMAFFGHGECIGGPAHCDPPAASRQGFDRRPSHHNTPRNFKLDVTDCVKKLRTNGHSDLKVTLVAMSPDPNRTVKDLRLDGVSINFIG
jgi:tyrosinase